MKLLFTILILLSSPAVNAKSDIWVCPGDDGKRYYANKEFNSQQCREADLPPISAVLPASHAKKRRPIALGMTRERVIANWGRPNKIFRTMSTKGVYEQWDYPQDNRLYFSDGILEAIQDQI